MKIAWAFIFLFAATFANAADGIKMYFSNEEITKIIEIYSKASGQKFVVDPGVRGKVSIYLPEPVSVEEAFNQLSTALALNGFAISKQGDTMVVKSARNIQRDLIDVTTELPSLKPERMVTWIYTVKNVPADQVNRDLRILSSKDGEMSVLAAKNQLIFTDWTSNLNRIAAIMKQLDTPADPSVAKLVSISTKEIEARKKESALKKEAKDKEKEKTEK